MRIDYNKYDQLIDYINVDNFFNRDSELSKKVSEYSQPVTIDNQPILIDIDIEQYYIILNNSKSKSESSVSISKLLFKDFTLNGKPLPESIMYEKEVWTYLNLTVFFELTKRKYIDGELDDEKLLGKIKRLYFNTGGLSKLDRTGLRNLWVLADALSTNGNNDLIDIAFGFYDPFKAIQECVLGNNKIVLKAYALAFKKLDFDKRLKNAYFRKIIPKHIRNHACTNFYDGYDDANVLSEVIAKQMKLILETYSIFEYLDDDSNLEL